MGARKKPTALKVLKGTLQKCRENRDEPVATAGRPEPPTDLDGIAIAEWHRTVIELEEMGIMYRADHAALEAYCANYSRWKRAESMLRQEGDVITAHNGFRMPHPAIRIANQALTLMRQYLTEFGLSPSSRAGVKTTNLKSEVNPFEAILGGKAKR